MLNSFQTGAQERVTGKDGSLINARFRLPDLSVCRQGPKKKKRKIDKEDPAYTMKKCRARYGLEQQQLWWELSSSKSNCNNQINNRAHDLETQVQTLQKKKEVCKSSNVSAREVIIVSSVNS